MDFATLTPRGVRWIQNNWDNFDFEMSIQRKGGLWNDRKKTMLVHTAIANYPSNPIFCIDIGDKKLEFIEGKQRMNTLKEYLDDKFALTDDILDAPKNEEIDLEELVGKTFSELDKKYQDKILDFRFQYISIKDATEEEIEEIMFRLNDSTVMSEMEKTRIKCSQKVRDFLAEIADMEFLSQQVAFTSTDRQRFIDQQKVLELFSVVMDKDFDFKGSKLREFSLELKEEIPEDKKTIMINTLNYLADAFREEVSEKKQCVAELKKIHIVGIFKVALQAKDEIEPKRFANIILSFLKEQIHQRNLHRQDNKISIGRYNEACDNASATRDSIDARNDEVMAYYENAIEEVELSKVSGL